MIKNIINDGLPIGCYVAFDENNFFAINDNYKLLYYNQTNLI